MTITLDAFRAQLDSLLSADDSELDALKRRRMIRAAVDRYALDRPAEAVSDVTGTGSRYYPLVGAGAVLASWQDEFSRIIGIEYPASAVASNATPTYLEDGSWRDDYEAGGIKYLYLPNHAPAATETMRIRYSAPYTWTAGSAPTAYTQLAHGLTVGDYCYQDGLTWTKAADPAIATHKVAAAADANSFTAALLEVNVPARDFFAVCYLAAALSCQAIATKYSRTNDSTIQADSVQHVSRAGEFSRRAKEFMNLYNGALGGSDGESKPSGSAQFVDFDAAPGWPGSRDFIFHGRGNR